MNIRVEYSTSNLVSKTPNNFIFVMLYCEFCWDCDIGHITFCTLVWTLLQNEAGNFEDASISTIDLNAVSNDSAHCIKMLNVVKYGVRCFIQQ